MPSYQLHFCRGCIPGKVVSDQHFQKLKLSQAKATFDLMRAGNNAEKKLAPEFDAGTCISLV